MSKDSYKELLGIDIGTATSRLKRNISLSEQIKKLYEFKITDFEKDLELLTRVISNDEWSQQLKNIKSYRHVGSILNLLDEQNNMHLKIMLNNSDLLVKDLSNIIYEYACV